MIFSTYEAIAFRRSGLVLHATFNRPDTRNAFDAVLGRDVCRLFDDVARDDETAVLVLTGAGRAFSAGGDIERMQQLIDHPDLLLKGAADNRRLLFSLLDCPKPVIAKINGPAIGLGATIALFCDIVIAAKEAKIADSHVMVGFAAGDGGAVIWPQLIGFARAKEYLLTGDSLIGEEAARIGLITRAVAADELDRVVDEFAQRLAAGAGRAIQWTKLAVNTGLKHSMQQILDTATAYEALSNLTKDHQEAVNAFREKRQPRFTGE